MTTLAISTLGTIAGIIAIGIIVTAVVVLIYQHGKSAGRKPRK